MQNLIVNVEIKPFKVETIDSMNEAIGGSVLIKIQCIYIGVA